MPRRENDPVAQQNEYPFVEAIMRRFKEAQDLFDQYSKVKFTDDPKKGMEAYEKLSEANYIRQAVNEALIKRVRKLSSKQIKGMYHSFTSENFKKRVKAWQFQRIMMGEKVEGLSLVYTGLFKEVGMENILSVLDGALKPEDKGALLNEVNGIVSPNDPTFPKERLTVCPEDQQIKALENSIAADDPKADEKKELLQRARNALAITSSEASSFYQFKAKSIENSQLKGLENEIDHETNAIFTKYVDQYDKTGMKDILRKDSRGHYTDAYLNDKEPLTEAQWQEMQSLRSNISPEVKDAVKQIMEEFSKFGEEEFEKFGLKGPVTKRDGTVAIEYKSEQGNKLYSFGVLSVAQRELRSAIKTGNFDSIKEKTEKYEKVRGQMDRIMKLVHGGEDFPCWGGNITPTRQLNGDGTNPLPPEYLKDYAGINKVNSFFQLYMMCKRYHVDIDQLLEDPVNIMANVEQRIYNEYTPENFDSNVSKLVVGLSSERCNNAEMAITFSAGFLTRAKGALAGLAKDEVEREKLIGAFGVTEIMIVKKRAADMKLWNELHNLPKVKKDALYTEAFLSEKGKFDVFGVLETLRKNDWKEQLNQDERIQSMSLEELHERIEESIKDANALPDNFGDHDKTAKFLRVADDLSKRAMAFATEKVKKPEAYQNLVKQHSKTVRSYLQLEDKNTYYENYNNVKRDVDGYDSYGKNTA